jgi:hypothetical protein
VCQVAVITPCVSRTDHNIPLDARPQEYPEGRCYRRALPSVNNKVVAKDALRRITAQTLRDRFCCRLLRHEPASPNRPIPAAKSGKAAGSGVAAGTGSSKVMVGFRFQSL